MRVAVIGAGIAGLTAARLIADHGHAVVVLDKGRGPGGRACSRRREAFVFDHGAQYFTAKDERFRRHVISWLQNEVVARWTPRLAVHDADGVRPPREVRERFVGVPGMSAVAKHLARDLQVRSMVRADRLVRAGAGWRIESGTGEVLAVAEAVVIAVPPAQAAPFLFAAPELARQVEAVTMRPCWAVMLGFAHPLPVTFDGMFVNVGPLSWVARNSSKPGRDGGEAWVLHASAAWSEQNLEQVDTEVAEQLRAEFETRIIGSALPDVRFAEAHRWRYAQPDSALDSHFLIDDDQLIGVTGDWCGGPRIEGAFLGGLALAECIVNRAEELYGGDHGSSSGQGHQR